jgi:DNA repair exonuclease SbcCD ATPase subunit
MVKVKAQLKQTITELKTKIENGEKEIIKIKVALADAQSSISKLKSDKERYEEEKKKLEFFTEQGLKEIEYRPNLIAELDAKLLEIYEKKNALIKSKPNLKEPIARREKLKETLEELLPTYKALQHKIKLYQWLIDEPLSNRGIKAYIFNSMLSLVNQQLKGYSKYTGFNIVLSIDLESHRKNFEAFIYKKDMRINYDDLSGGQQQLADLCLAVATHDVMTANSRMNILLIDEAFESLDENNVDIVMEMLQSKANVSIHLITHLQKIFTYKFSKKLHLTNRSGKMEQA